MARSYGWRPSPPDHRDEHFKFRPHAHILQAVRDIPQFSLNNPALPAPFNPPLNQQTIGSCGPHSAAKNLIFKLLKTLGHSQVPSRLFIYWIARKLMGTTASDSGVDNRSMLKAIAQYGWCDESLWPYDVSKVFVEPPQACFDQAKTRAGKIVYQAVDQDIDNVKACLYQTGAPFILGFSVCQSMERPDVDRSGVIPMPGGLLDRVIGGHDVICTGWDDLRQLLEFQNHWYVTETQPWGNNGYGYMPYAYAFSKLASDWWTITAAGIDAPTPPSPQPSPQPGPAPAPEHATLGVRVTTDGKNWLKATGWQNVPAAV